MKKEKIFLIIGVICAIGTLAMLSEKNWGATIFYLIIAIICFIFSKNFISNIFNNKKKKNQQNKKNKINDIKNSAKNIQEKSKEIVSNVSKTIQEKIADNAKWKVILINEISVNKENKLIKIHNKTYHFEDIIDCELIEDGNSITKSSLLGTAAKGLAFGLAGYLTSEKKQKKYCNKLEVKITINDFNNPCVYCKFIKKKTKVQSSEYEKAFNNAQKCLSTIKIVLENK